MNTINGSDVELLPFGTGVIGITTDMLEEEIELGLFTDPEMLGWLTVAMSLSDVAAAGCQPLGVLSQITISEHMPVEWCEAFFRGMQDCCDRHGTFILGGDTNLGRLRLGSCAIGTATHMVGDPRRQLRPGHHLYTTRPVGSGNRLAYARLANHASVKDLDAAFRPFVDFALGALAIELGGACIDTSDGFFPTLYTLLACQNAPMGAVIDADLTVDVAKFASMVGLPPLAFLLGEVGDYGLLFSIPSERNSEFERRLASLHSAGSVVRVGSVTEGSEIIVHAPTAYTWSLDQFGSYRGRSGSVKERLAAILSLLRS